LESKKICIRPSKGWMRVSLRVLLVSDVGPLVIVTVGLIDKRVINNLVRLLFCAIMSYKLTMCCFH